MAKIAVDGTFSGEDTFLEIGRSKSFQPRDLPQRSPSFQPRIPSNLRQSFQGRDLSLSERSDVSECSNDGGGGARGGLFAWLCGAGATKKWRRNTKEVIYGRKKVMVHNDATVPIKVYISSVPIKSLAVKIGVAGVGSLQATSSRASNTPAKVQQTLLIPGAEREFHLAADHIHLTVFMKLEEGWKQLWKDRECQVKQHDVVILNRHEEEAHLQPTGLMTPEKWEALDDLC